MEPVTFDVVDPGSSEARGAMAQYFHELADRLPGGFDHGDALDEGAAQYQHPTGVFLLARRGKEVVGCGALGLLDASTAEIKRMWIDPAARGAGIGQRLLARLEDEARRAGCSTVFLDTNATLTEAVAMYESSGYARTERYNDNPYAEVWFTKSFGDPPEPAR